MKLRTGDKLFAAGGFRRGKSTLVRYIATTALRACVVADFVGEYRGAPFVPCTLQQAPDLIRRGARYVSVQLDPDEFDDFCTFAMTLRGWGVVIDEISLVITGTSPASLPRPFSKLWRLGHKQGLTTLIATHRVTEVPALLRVVQHQIYFQTPVSVDIKAAKETIGDAAEAMRTLPRFHYLYVGPDGAPVVCKPVPSRGHTRAPPPAVEGAKAPAESPSPPEASQLSQRESA